ncbi:MAG: adenine phosphoribosyltransferase [Gemmatimonadales bacterium]|nr:adenine phosphoribosyltransferase [Gemmatimonadales bacterium]
MDLKKIIRAVPDFPKPGILFQDITPVMENPTAYRFALDGMKSLLDPGKFNKFAAIESRGFLFGGPLCLEMDRGMVLLRKAGKLPAETMAVTYALEYGEATLEVHRGSFGPGDRVIIVDDLLATGGTAAATAQLVQKSGAEVAGFLFLVELDFLEGRKVIQEAGPVFSLVSYS